jgi:hypothetical protein
VSISFVADKASSGSGPPYGGISLCELLPPMRIVAVCNFVRSSKMALRSIERRPDGKEMLLLEAGMRC